ncbi:MAG: LPS export ABC transporter permease LptG [Pseudomonadota bacterium]
MSILVRYLMNAVLSMTVLVLMVLLAIAGFVEFIAQLDTVGEGDFSVRSALLYALLRLPLLAAQMVPVAALIGALLGLGQLASHSELTVMRAAGVSKLRLASTIAISGLVLTFVTFVVGEFLAPPLDQFARTYRASLKRGNDATAALGNVWVRDGATIYNIERLSGELDLGRVYRFEFDDSQRLTAIGYALNGGLNSDDQWVLNNFVATHFDSDGTHVEAYARSVQDVSINTELLGVALIRPTSLSLRSLRAYVRYLSTNGLTADAYQSEYWSRLATLVAIILMPVLAIGFVFGSLRDAGNGARTLVGIMIGLGWYLATRLLSNSGQVFDLNIVLTAWIPSIALALITAIAVSRVR